MIKQYYFSSKLPAGVVLFCDPSSRLFVTFPTDSRAPAWIADLLVRADVLYSEIREILRDPNRGLCLEMVFSRIVQLLKVMEHEDQRQLGSGELSSDAPAEESTHVDGPVGEHSASGLDHSTDSSVVAKHKPLRVPTAWHLPPWPDLERIYESQYAQGADLVRRMCQRQAQIDYFSGMVWGGLALSLIVSLVLFVPIRFGVTPIAQLLQMDQILAPLIWLTPVIGGIGAVVSVMQRMGSGSLVLRDRAGRSALVMMGAFRPLVGAVFASVVAALLSTGLVPIKMPDGVPPTVVVYSVVAFFAGFSERFAQDMLGAGEMAVAGGTEAERRAAAT
jgi:hypothetical protein